MGLTRSTLVVLFSLLLILQPLANAQDQAQARPGAAAPAAAPAPAAGRPGAAPPPDQVPAQPAAPAGAPAAGRPGAQVPVQPSTPPAGDPAQTRPKVYSCPADNGARYTTENGVTFELKCDHGTTAKPLNNIPTNSQKECADYCSTLPNCQSADWNDRSKLCATKQEVCVIFTLWMSTQSANFSSTYRWVELSFKQKSICSLTCVLLTRKDVSSSRNTHLVSARRAKTAPWHRVPYTTRVPSTQGSSRRKRDREREFYSWWPMSNQ